MCRLFGCLRDLLVLRVWRIKARRQRYEDRRLVFIYDPWFGQAYGILAEHNTVGLRKNYPSGLQLPAEVAEGKAPLKLPPGETLHLKRRIFPGKDLFQVRAIASRLLGEQTHEITLTAATPHLSGQALSSVFLLSTFTAS